nr:MAG TPA: hypothetical protein [Caudoviricetes sp.]
MFSICNHICSPVYYISCIVICKPYIIISFIYKIITIKFYRC